MTPVPEDLLESDGDAQAFWLGPRDTLAEALATMRRNGRGLGVVVDSDELVMGAVTDSTIRRAALSGRGMDTTVSEVMPEHFVSVGPSATPEDIVALLHTHRLRSVPVVDADRLIDVRSLSRLPAEGAPPIAVIMAGGRGQRLRPLTDKVPKPLLRVGSKSIVERLIESVAGAGVHEVFLAVNYKAEIFEQRLGSGEHLGVRLHYIREEQAMGTAGALSLLSGHTDGQILVLNGDIVTTVDFAGLFDFHWRHGPMATVGGVEHVSHIPYGVLRNVEHYLLSMEEKPVRRDLCSAGIYVLDPGVLRFLRPNEAMDMPDLLAQVLGEGRPVQVFPILEEWYDIGGTAEFERVLVQFATGDAD